MALLTLRDAEMADAMMPTFHDDAANLCAELAAAPGWRTSIRAGLPFGVFWRRCRHVISYVPSCAALQRERFRQPMGVSERSRPFTGILFIFLFRRFFMRCAGAARSRQIIAEYANLKWPSTTITSIDDARPYS